MFPTCPTIVRMRTTVSGSYTYTEYDESDNLPSANEPPVCAHCKSHNLMKHGFDGGKQRYLCRDCNRRSRGFLPPPRPRCPHCKTPNPTKRSKVSHNRARYQCRACRRCFTETPLRGFNEHGLVAKQQFTVKLNAAANNALRRYIQATGLTTAASVRAIFRTALDEDAFATVTGAKATYDDQGRFTGTRIRHVRYRPEPQSPEAIAAPLPSLRNDNTARLQAASPNWLFGSYIGCVAQVCSKLDDAAKAGLLHAMTRTGLNHADAARLLIARAEPPPNKQENPPVSPKHRP